MARATGNAWRTGKERHGQRTDWPDWPRFTPSPFDFKEPEAGSWPRGGVRAPGEAELRPERRGEGLAATDGEAPPSNTLLVVTPAVALSTSSCPDGDRDRDGDGDGAYASARARRRYASDSRRDCNCSRVPGRGECQLGTEIGHHRMRAQGRGGGLSGCA